MAEDRLDPATFLREQVAPRARRRIEDLRGQVTRLQAELDDRLAAEATVQLVLEGEGGGTWFLHLAAGDMQVSDRAPSDPIVRVYQSRDDWEALARAQLASGAANAPMGGDLTRSRIARLRAIQGTLEFRLTDDASEQTIQVQLGPGDRTPPRCTIRVRAEDARRMQAGELPPQIAFMQGLVKLEGDLAFAMQVGAALLT
jgi:hypothetical protein